MRVLAVILFCALILGVGFAVKIQREGERERVALAARVVAVEERVAAVDLKSRNEADGECINKIVALASEYAGTDREGWALDYAFFWSGKLHGAEDQKSRDFVLRLFEKAKAGR